MDRLDYETAWSSLWDDCMLYGPSRRHQQRIIKECIKDISFNSVLEVGCGNGMNLVNLVRHFKISRFAGMDISKEALQKVKEILPSGEYYQMDVQRDFLKQNYDLILCCDTLEHLEDDISCLINISKMADKYVLISTLTGKMRDSEIDVGHIRNYNQEDLLTKLNAAGFEPIKIINWGFPFFSPMHRSLLDKFPQKINYGKFGAFRKLASNVLYLLFFLNSSCRGDYIFILAKKI